MQQVLENGPVRIHKSLALRHPAASLWYLCRAKDKLGRGYVVLWTSEWQLLKVSKKTIYRWLRQGREIGLFRTYTFRPDDSLYISLGSLKKACIKSGLKSWGPVATVKLGDILDGRLRAVAATIQAQDLQEKSRYAAVNALNRVERRYFKVPTAAEVLSPTSQKMPGGVVPGLIHVGPAKAFANSRFIPFGVSQQQICEQLNAEVTSCGVCPRTLRNYLKRLGVEHRQLVQAKPEYKELELAIAYDAEQYQAKGDSSIYFKRESHNTIRLYEPNGRSSARREGGHLVKTERFFRYFNSDWLYRCNLYGLNYELNSMSLSRYKYKQLSQQELQVAVSVVPVSVPAVENNEPAGYREGALAGERKHFYSAY